MRIGILTFHAAKNYGAVLQCRCLYEVLKSLGHDVSVIDYRPDYLIEPYKIWKNKFLKHPMTMLKVSSRLAGSLRRNAAFDEFEKEFDLAQPGTTGFDAILYGSDQIWNSRICGGFDPVFFAAAPYAQGVRNISYAASDGGIELSEDEKKQFRHYLHNFYRIGVREYPMQERMDEAGIPACVNIDPVLLAGRPIVDLLCSAPACEKGYILTYEAIDNPAVPATAQRAAAEKGLHVVSISRSPYSEGINKYGPKEFVALFRDAEEVVTTSFHGTVLSLLYHKPFRFIPTKTHADERILSLLNALGVKDGKTPDWDAVDRKLDALREESVNYIKEALQ
ncbi:MAG: polysaccharide pyruvyl transferase family protein [Bacteroidales bacterium]|nr:polysaccharide pyruvyl transferase family protein [Bacteroidales bacterium]